jgi:hypothetical protein
MFCPKCGAEIADGSRFCPKCGSAIQAAVVPQAPMPQAPMPQVAGTTRTSGMAIASLVLGIISIIINPLSILAIIFGGVAMGQMGKDPTLGGKGLAIAGLVIGIVMFVLWIVALIWLQATFSYFF